MNENLCELVVILDRSGSMSTIWSDMIGGLNSFVNEQKKVPGEAKFTLVVFDTEYKMIYGGIDLHRVSYIDGNQFPPRSATALLDAVGHTIDEVGARLANLPEEERPRKVIVTIITDGVENASNKYTRQTIADKIKHQAEVYKWEFQYLGANQDAITVGGKLNIANNFTWDSTTSAGVKRMSAVYRTSVTHSRTKKD